MAPAQTASPQEDMGSFEINRENYDSFNEERLAFRPKPGISEEIVREISRQKNEPGWMLQKRLAV